MSCTRRNALSEDLATVRNSPLTRALVRIRGARSTDDRDVARELRRALNRAAQRKGNPQRVQVAAETLTADDYARWRERKLRRGALTSAPTVAPGHYALVLVAFDPASTEQFIRHGAATHLTPPKVGEFTPAVEPTVALAGVLAYWLDAFERPVALAPPLLHTGTRWGVADLGLDWPLAPYVPKPH